MIRIALYSILLNFVGSSCVFAQGDTTKIDTITVNSDYASLRKAQTAVVAVRIQRRLATDVGQIMSLFTGIQTKSYGGLGGMKTVTFRSLGSGHISTVYDGFTLTQTQSGQTDLGQLPVDFVNRVTLVGFDPLSLVHPVHAKLAGQIISIETRHLENRDKFNLNLGSQIGSFGQVDGHGFVAKQWGKWRVGLSGKARRFDGAYPFSYMNGLTEVSTKRQNGDLKDVFGTATVTWMPASGHRLHLSYNGTSYSKGLPGAVVYYNENAAQRLSGTNQLISLRHQGMWGKWNMASGASFQESQLRYVDSNYLNSIGYLEANYRGQESGLNTQWRRSFLNDSLQFLIGTGIRFERLFTEQYTTSPNRFSTDIIGAMELKRLISVKIQLGLQDVNDLRGNGDNRHTLAVQPAAELLWSNQTFGVITGYRYTVRQPSFNELYYNQLGNTGLLPERAHLAYICGKIVKSFGKTSDHYYQGTIQPFYTHASDKILAIPTKNLFVWSIQNIGLSDAWGTELQQLINFSKGPFRTSLRLQYTFQYTMDLSDPNSSSYRDLLSYSPIHAGTGELDFHLKNWELSFLATYQGERYALNQNIPANMLDDFWLFDASLAYHFDWKNHDLNVRLAVNNIANNYYSYIRYFIMPGRNFALNLSYDF